MADKKETKGTLKAPKVEHNLTTKSLGVDAKAAIEAAVKALGENPTEEQLASIRVPIGMMYGIITQVKPLMDNKTGEVRSVLVGQFEGVNAATGEVVRSARCYVPMVQETVESDFNSLPANVRGNRMKFQANLYAIYRDDRYGFNWSVDLPLRDTNDDPLADMRGDLTKL